jgi:hypothetical protein
VTQRHCFIFFRSQRLAPPRGPFLGQVFKWAADNSQFSKSREDFVPNPRHETVLNLRDEDEPFVFVNAHELRIEAMRTGNVTTNDELLLHVRTVLDPGT